MINNNLGVREKRSEGNGNRTEDVKLLAFQQIWFNFLANFELVSYRGSFNIEFALLNCHFFFISFAEDEFFSEYSY